jgi:hypothetical protein
MIECDADVVFIDGPMTYMLGYRYSEKLFQESLNNLAQLMEKTNLKRLVIDHHLTRDLKWKNKMDTIFKKGEEHGVNIQSAAEFAGMKEDLLEARRKELYRDYPVNK